MRLPLVSTDKTYRHPVKLDNDFGMRIYWMPSQFYASEPKASITVALRNQQAISDARQQVLFGLNDYLASLALDELSSRRLLAASVFQPAKTMVWSLMPAASHNACLTCLSS